MPAATRKQRGIQSSRRGRDRGREKEKLRIHCDWRTRKFISSLMALYTFAHEMQMLEREMKFRIKCRAIIIRGGDEREPRLRGERVSLMR